MLDTNIVIALFADEAIVKSNLAQAETTRQYGEVKNKLRLKGRPLPENDVWIAALTRHNALILVKRDAHFQEVESLQTVAW